MDRNFRDMLSALRAADADFLIVGAHALAVHGKPRATGDLDIWVRPTVQNAARVYRALVEFGAPLHGITVADFATPHTVYQIGLPPSRIDILTGIDGVTFDEAWPRRVQVSQPGLELPVLGRDDLIANKRAAGRPKDLVDVAELLAGDEGLGG